MKKPVSTLLLLLFCFTLFSQKLKVGDKIEKIGVEEIFYASGDNFDEADLKGKALLIEFWATWCAPCVSLIPEINALQHKFQDKPVYFLSVSNEERSRVEKFVREKRHINGLIGIDHDGSLLKDFGFKSIPQTVLVYPSGKIAAITHAMLVDENILEDLLAEDPIDLPHFQPASNKLVDNNSSEEGNKFSIEIKKSDSDQLNLNTNTNDGWKSIKGTTNLESLLQMVYDIPTYRIDGPGSLLNEKYDLEIMTSTSGNESFDELLRHVVSSKAEIEVKRRYEEQKGYVLKPIDSFNMTSIESKNSRSSTSYGVIAAQGYPLDHLASQISDILDVDVLFESDDDKIYEWTLTYDADNPQSLIDSLKSQLGLELEPVNRELEMLEVRSK